MNELLSGIAIVVSVIAFVTTLVVANEVGLQRQIGPVGTVVVAQEGAQALSGERVLLPPNGRSILFFSLAGCGACESILERLASAPVRTRDAIVLVVRAERATAEQQARVSGLDRRRVIVDSDGTVTGRFHVSSFPAAVVS